MSFLNSIFILLAVASSCSVGAHEAPEEDHCVWTLGVTCFPQHTSIRIHYERDGETYRTPSVGWQVGYHTAQGRWCEHDLTGERAVGYIGLTGQQVWDRFQNVDYDTKIAGWKQYNNPSSITICCCVGDGNSDDAVCQCCGRTDLVVA